MAPLPEGQDVALPGCSAAGCPWETARRRSRKAIDPEFVEGLSGEYELSLRNPEV
jgi:hypothetical protein